MDVTPQYLFLSTIFGLVIGLGCSYLAQQRGRGARTWFFLGFFFGLLGLIALMIMPDLKKKEIESEGEGVGLTEAQLPDPETKEWFFIDSEGVQNGPVTFKLLKQLFDDKKISSISYIWCEGMEEWKTIEESRLFTS